MQQSSSLLFWRLFTACFGRFPAHHQELNDCSGSLWFYLRIVVIVVLCSRSGLPAGWPDHKHSTTYHHNTKVKPEAATAAIEFLMMAGKTPETCWAVNKLQDNKLKNCCIRLVIYLNCTIMHGLTNLKFYISILAHSVSKMWIIQEPKKVALWKKRHFEGKNGVCAACLKYSVFIFVEKIYKMQHLEGSGTPVLYIGHTVLKG